MMIELLVSLYCVGNEKKKNITCWKADKVLLHFIGSGDNSASCYNDCGRWDDDYHHSRWTWLAGKAIRDGIYSLSLARQHEMKCTDSWCCLRQCLASGLKCVRWGCERIMISMKASTKMLSLTVNRFHLFRVSWNPDKTCLMKPVGRLWMAILTTTFLKNNASLLFVCLSVKLRHSLCSGNSFISKWAIFTVNWDNLHVECKQ